MGTGRARASSATTLPYNEKNTTHMEKSGFHGWNISIS